MKKLLTFKIPGYWWVIVASLLFIAANTFCIANEFYWLNLLPPALLIIVLALIALDKLVLFCVFLTPLSVNLASQDFRLGLSLPVEPILAGILFLFILRLLYEGAIDRRLLRHPVTIAILLNTCWIFITCITSELPEISFKFLIARLWFIVPFYFIGVMMFRDIKNVRRFIWLYIIPLTFVIGFTIFIHAKFSFNEDAAHWAMSPFYNDHTAYGAALSMFYPLLFAFAFSKRYSNNIRIISVILLIVFSIALLLSYTRAAWVSLIAAFLLLLVFLLRIRFRWLLIIAVISGFFLYVSWTTFMMQLEQNTQDTSTDLEQHLQSISNISTDASNLERINRWNSAFRMFRERPVFGWGPGTYSFLYAPFQLSGEKTIISTNAGDLGNAHSEYIGPLCESGVLGSATFFIIVCTIVWTGWRLYYKLPKGSTRGLLLAVLLGIFTYMVHGLMNNFLDTDKASVPFWGFAAILVAADIFYDGKKEETPDIPPEASGESA
ncbi:MAG TPA: O-antigen ligase family protein [Bacteroidia bacterium]|nr:O-antigen ligase family protein [Bacteroidia bacterium]